MISVINTIICTNFFLQATRVFRPEAEISVVAWQKLMNSTVFSILSFTKWNNSLWKHVWTPFCNRGPLGFLAILKTILSNSRLNRKMQLFIKKRVHYLLNHRACNNPTLGILSTLIIPSWERERNFSNMCYRICLDVIIGEVIDIPSSGLFFRNCLSNSSAFLLEQKSSLNLGC